MTEENIQRTMRRLLGEDMGKDILEIRAIEAIKEYEPDIFSEEKDISHIQVSPSNISPLPQTIIIGKNYTFLGSDNVLAVSSEANRTKSETISVLFPQEFSVEAVIFC